MGPQVLGAEPTGGTTVECESLLVVLARRGWVRLAHRFALGHSETEELFGLDTAHITRQVALQQAFGLVSPGISLDLKSQKMSNGSHRPTGWHSLPSASVL